MRSRPYPSRVERILHAALDRLSLHYIAHQATRRGYQLCEDRPDEDGHEVDVDVEGIVDACHCFRRGDTAEALFRLERALPDGFAGLATAVVPVPPR